MEARVLAVLADKTRVVAVVVVVERQVLLVAVEARALSLFVTSQQMLQVQPSQVVQQPLTAHTQLEHSSHQEVW